MDEAEMRTMEVLLIEDNPGDVFLTKKALSQANIDINVTVAPDGEAGLDLLSNALEKGDANWPDIVLLDVNLPKKDGKQVLAEMKQSPDLKRIPVVILTSSSAEKDILQSYDLHANSYIIKPVNLEKFCDVASVLENYWFCVVSRPKS